MRRILALVLTLALVFGLASFTAIATPGDAPDRIEISFRVGDSILNINGEPVEVETPFVAGDGVTLVPLRVITEAFGADVDWIGDTRQIILTYLNVEIVLQIENINVYINEQRQTLLYNPLIVNNVTMVPLRFISENFGAEVGWDGDTQAITVVKELSDGQLHDIEDVLRRSNMPNVGDSFLGWSMRIAPDMELGFRQFDGRCNIFYLADGDVMIDIDHFDNTDNESFAAIQAWAMEHARTFTLVGQNVRRTQSGAEFVVTQYRDRNYFVDWRIFVRPNNQLVHITTLIDGSFSTSEREEFLAVVDTFDFTFNAAETEDLSDVVSGMRLFSDDDLNIAFRIPADWRDFTDMRRINRFFMGEFSEDRTFVTGAAIEVVSIQGNDTAARWAGEFLAHETRTLNPNTHTFTELRTTRIGGRAATYYQVELRLAGANFVNRNIFWDYEGYLYNLNITVPAANSATIQRIVESVSFEAITPETVGVLQREPLADEDVVLSTVRNTSLNFSIDVPAAWSRLDNNTVFVNERNGVSIAVGRLDNTMTLTEVRRFADDIAGPDMRIVSQPAQIQSSDLSSSALRGFVFEVRATSANRQPIYGLIYIINSGNRAYVIAVDIPETSNAPAIRENIARIVRSFVVN